MSSPPPDYEKLFASFFHKAADLAGAIALRYFRTPLPIDQKGDKSPVTEADRLIEQSLRDLIGKAFPSHGIIGEEFGNANVDAEFVWVIDPIDGTRAFMTGKPLFGTILGLLHKGAPVVGCIDQAFIKERWFGIASEKAAYNGNAIRVAAPCPLSSARLYTGAHEMFSGPHFEKFLNLCRTVKWPQYGCDCYAYGLLALGCCDLVVEQDLKIHDVAGLIPIITGAGGFASDWGLNPVGLDFSGRFIAAASRELAEEAMRILEPRSI